MIRRGQENGTNASVVLSRPSSIFASPPHRDIQQDGRDTSNTNDTRAQARRLSSSAAGARASSSSRRGRLTPSSGTILGAGRLPERCPRHGSGGRTHRDSGRSPSRKWRSASWPGLYARRSGRLNFWQRARVLLRKAPNLRSPRDGLDCLRHGGRAGEHWLCSRVAAGTILLHEGERGRYVQVSMPGGLPRGHVPRRLPRRLVERLQECLGDEARPRGGCRS
ncbi:hypothetical protein DFH06DRAFT_1234229 [Mycena polygramma]|nr:hypothetical protein DFH06DRAFT_1234229 [Mycena polygramma]